MSLDLTLYKEVYSCNITHNLTSMAKEVELYGVLWHPEENGIYQAEQLINPITKALNDMKKRPKYYKQYDSPNGWGVYEDFVKFLEELLEMCHTFKYSKIEVSI